MLLTLHPLFLILTAVTRSLVPSCKRQGTNTNGPTWSCTDIQHANAFKRGSAKGQEFVLAPVCECVCILERPPKTSRFVVFSFSGVFFSLSLSYGSSSLCLGRTAGRDGEDARAAAAASFKTEQAFTCKYLTSWDQMWLIKKNYFVRTVSVLWEKQKPSKNKCVQKSNYFYVFHFPIQQRQMRLNGIEVFAYIHYFFYEKKDKWLEWYRSYLASKLNSLMNWIQNIRL